MIISLYLAILTAFLLNGPAYAAADTLLKCDSLLADPTARDATKRLRKIFIADRSMSRDTALFVGLSRHELIELLNTGRVSSATQIWVYVVGSHPSVIALAARYPARSLRSFATNEAFAMAMREAWIGTVRDLLASRRSGIDLSGKRVREFLSTLHDHAQGKDVFSPSYRTLREAADAASLARINSWYWGNLQALAAVLNVRWADPSRDDSPMARELVGTFANLPVAGGVVLALRSGALAKLGWGTTVAPKLKTVMLDDVIAVRPAADAELKFLEQLPTR